jgi:hypothetical protein
MIAHQNRRQCICSLVFLAAAVSLLGLANASAQESAAPAGDPLDAVEARLAERYDRLELLAGRLAELSGSTQPQRAELLRQLVARGREQDVPGQFDAIVAALAGESYSTALDGQTRLQGELEKLLELLLQEDRNRQLESERKRILRYLQDLNKVIRLQRGVTARTEGGDAAPQLAEDQERVGDDAEQLEQEIKENESTEEREGEGGAESESRPSGQSPNDSGRQGTPSDPSEGEQQPGEQQDGEQPEGEQDREDRDSEEKQPGEQPSGENESGEQQSGEQQSGQQQSGQQQSGESQQSQGGQSESQQPQQQSPMQRAAEALRRAQQRMDDAQKKLEEAERDGAAEDQRQALNELQEAKAEFEKILRQLREEEMERMLVLLEARFRKMLDEQTAVYEETQKLDAAAAKAPEHEIEIAAGRLSRREANIVREAERVLVLLREDGTSVAFPEAVEQARDDMQEIAERLNRSRTDLITQTLEEDVIASLEETLAALQQALEDVRDKRAQQQQQGGGGGNSSEQSLVDQLAEIRMIRALQLRVNRRTEQFGAMIEGEQARESELLDMLDELALRQAKIQQATHDLDTGDNQ